MIKIYTLVEARRAIRRVLLNTEKVGRALLRASDKKETVIKVVPQLQQLSRLLQAAQINRESIRAVSIALHTQLLDTSNLVARLQRNTKMIENQCNEHIEEIEDRLSHLSTKFESKLKILLGDLSKRLEKHYTVRYLVRHIVDREIGVLMLRKVNDTRVALCAVITEPLDLNENKAINALGVNRYKIFFHEIPPDLSLENFHDFISPSKAIPDILASLQEEGF